jgi:hypothetical protein
MWRKREDLFFAKKQNGKWNEPTYFEGRGLWVEALIIIAPI